jgi:general secretion pathway protein J
VDEDNNLVRRHWLVMDATLAIKPIDTLVLKGVSRMEVRFLNGQREWISQWPQLESGGATSLRVRPLAVEVTLDVEGIGRLVRLLQVRG